MVTMAKYEKRIKELKEYRLTRGAKQEDDFFDTLMHNLLLNLSKRNNKIHGQLKAYKAAGKPADDDLRIDIGNYICGLVTCWETFFMEMFIFLCNNDRVIKAIFEQKHDGEDLQGLTIGEYAAIQYSFQNLERTRQAFDLAFGKTTTKFTEHLDVNLFSNMAFTSQLRLMSWVSDPAYLTLINVALETAFETRHKFTHDANYTINLETEMLANIEEIFQILPQLFMHNIAIRYNLSRTVFHTVHFYLRKTDQPEDAEKSYIFSAAEFMARNWQVINLETKKF